MPPSLPPIPPRPDMRSCRWCPSSRFRIAFPDRCVSVEPLPDGLMICTVCDMGGRPDAGPPVLLDYIRRGHQ